MLKKPSNKPRAAIIELARRQIAEHGGPSLARVYFKFDCGTCGSRERMPEPNVLAETGVCTVCGATTTVRAAGMALLIRRDTSVDWDAQVNTLVVRKPYASDRGDA